MNEQIQQDANFSNAVSGLVSALALSSRPLAA
jgi:hypothetical protein